MKFNIIKIHGMFLHNSIDSFKDCFIKMDTALDTDFLLNGIVHEFIPDAWIDKHPDDKGAKGILWPAVIRTLAPVDSIMAVGTL